MKFLYHYKLNLLMMIGYFIFAHEFLIINNLISKFSINKYFYDITHSEKDDFIIKKTMKLLKKFNSNDYTTPYIFILPGFNKKKVDKKFLNNLAESLSRKHKLDLNNLVLSVLTPFFSSSTTNDKLEMYVGSNIKKIFISKGHENYVEFLKKEINNKINSSGINYGAYHLVKNLFQMLNSNRISPIKHNPNFTGYSNKSKKEIIKCLILLPVIILLFMSICYIKKNSNLKNLETSMGNWKYLKGKMKSSEFIDKSCIICLEDFLNTGEDKNTSKSDNCSLLVKDLNHRIIKLGCSHIFHPDCIYKWINKRNTCPTCRQQIDFKKIELFKIEF